MNNSISDEKTIKGIIRNDTSKIFIPMENLNKLQQLEISNAISEDTFSKNPLMTYNAMEHNEKYKKDVLTPKRLFVKDVENGKEGFIAPIGLTDNVKKVLHKYSDLKLEIEDQRQEHDAHPFNLVGKTPRDYQKNIIESAMKNKNGLIVVGTGGGKTVIAGDIIAKEGQDTEFIVPNNTLLISTTNDLKEMMPPNVHVGQIGGGKDDLQDHPNEVDVNVVSLPLAKKVFSGVKKINPQIRKDVLRATDMANVMFVDEAQTISSESAKNVVSSSNAKYRFGMTATPYTPNGEIDLKQAFGENIGNLNAKKLIDLKQLTPPEIYRIDNSDINPQNDDQLLQNLKSDYCAIPKESYMYKQVFNAGTIPNKKSKFRVQYVRKGMVECNEERNKRISDIIERLDDNNKTTIVFLNSEEHGKKIVSQLAKHNVKATLFTGNTEKDIILTEKEKEKKIGLIKKREALFSRVKQGEIKTIITTPKLMGAGVSISGIDSVVYADVGKSKIDAVQTVGRAIRLKDGKTKALIFDFIDDGYDNAKYLSKWGKERAKAWQDEEYPMFEIKSNELEKIIPKKMK